MPQYQITDQYGRTLILEGDEPPTEADMDAAFQSLSNTQTDEGTMGSIAKQLGLPRQIPQTLDQLGLGVLRGVTETPGAIADLTQMGMNQLGKSTGLWNERDRGRGWAGYTRDKLIENEILPNLAPQDMVQRLAGMTGQGIGGAAAGGASGAIGVGGGAGGGLGAGVGAEIDPENGLLQFLLGLGGGIAGARSAARPPAPGPGLSNEMLSTRIKGGMGDPLPDTMADQLDMMSEGGPPGPVYEPGPPISPQQLSLARDAETRKGMLDAITMSRGLRADDAAENIQQFSPGAPTVLERTLYSTGLAPSKMAEKTAIFDAIKKVQDAEPGALKNLFGKAAKRLAKGALQAKLGNKYGVGNEALNFMFDVARGSAQSRLFDALDELETVVRTGEPIPTKGTALKNELKAMAGVRKKR
jgi:hypothetical protein